MQAKAAIRQAEASLLQAEANNEFAKQINLHLSVMKGIAFNVKSLEVATINLTKATERFMNRVVGTTISYYVKGTSLMGQSCALGL
jgi:hypothetical protein